MADEEELHVLRTLMDQRIHLDGGQALAAASMSREERVALLRRLVEGAHGQALAEDRGRSNRQKE